MALRSIVILSSVIALVAASGVVQANHLVGTVTNAPPLFIDTRCDNHDCAFVNIDNAVDGLTGAPLGNNLLDTSPAPGPATLPLFWGNNPLGAGGFVGGTGVVVSAGVVGLNTTAIATCENAVSHKIVWNVTTDRLVCATDRDTTYAAGSGLSLAGATFSIPAGAITSSMIVDGGIADADVSSIASIQWSKISKTGSSLADLSVRSAGDLTSGLLAPARGGTGIDTSTVPAGSLLRTTGTGAWGTLPPGAIGKVLKIDATGAPSWDVDSTSGGTVTQVGSGAGLTGGPITTSGTISLDTTGIAACVGASDKVLWNTTNGRLVCGADKDTDTTYSAGSGLALAGTTFSANPAVVQLRVTGSCSSGSYVRAIAQDGTVTCQSDVNSGGTVTQVNTGTGLTGGPITGSGTVSLNTAGVSACTGAAQKVLWDSASARLGCGADQDTDTTYSAGSGLTLAGTTFSISSGAITGAMIQDGTVKAADVDATVVQLRVTGSCSAGSYVRAIAQDGTVTCQSDANSGGTVTSVSAGTGLSGGPITSSGSLSLNTAGVSTCTGGTQKVLWDPANSRLGCGTDANSGGTVTSVSTGAGLTGGPITGSGTISIVDGGVTTAKLAGGAVTAAKIGEVCASGQLLKSTGGGVWACAADLSNPAAEPASGNIDANGFKVVNLATPTASADAATKGYVDAAVSGVTNAQWQQLASIAVTTSNVETTVTVPAICKSDGTGKGCALYLLQESLGSSTDCTSGAICISIADQYVQFVGAPIALDNKYIVSYFYDSSTSRSINQEAQTNGDTTGGRLGFAGGSATNYCQLLDDDTGAPIAEQSATQWTLQKVGGTSFGCILYARVL